MIAKNLSEFLADPLSQLEWRVARRADEIAHARQLQSPLNLHCWLVAETEVWGEFNQGSGQPGPVLRSRDHPA